MPVERPPWRGCSPAPENVPSRRFVSCSLGGAPRFSESFVAGLALSDLRVMIEFLEGRNECTKTLCKLRTNGSQKMTRLSADLQPIYDLEIARGNEVSHIEEPAGSTCPYAIVFKQPLDKNRILAKLQLPAHVRYWESRDPHYAIEAGFYSDASQHSIAGPLQ